MAKKKALEDLRELTPEEVLAGRNIRYHFLDSGAFSLRLLAAKWAKATGEDSLGYYDSPEHFHYLDAYADFVKREKIGIDMFANVDVMGDAERSFRNQLYLESKGVKPVPVIHFGDSVEILEKYLDRGYRYIGLGGFARKTMKAGMTEQVQAWLDTMFECICDTPDRTPCTRVHAFGVNRLKWLLRYPWFSVDATSWIHHAAYGDILVPKTQRSLTRPERSEFSVDEWFYSFNYNLSPEVVDVTPQTLKSLSGNHLQYMKQMNHLRATRIEAWLDFIGIPFGVTEGNLEDPKEWIIVEEGVSNSQRKRELANIRFFLEFVKTIPPYPRPFSLVVRPTLGLLS